MDENLEISKLKNPLKSQLRDRKPTVLGTIDVSKEFYSYPQDFSPPTAFVILGCFFFLCHSPTPGTFISFFFGAFFPFFIFFFFTIFLLLYFLLFLFPG